MKNILRTVLLLVFINCNSQTIVDISTYNQGDNSNKYFKDLSDNSQYFVGTWENTTTTWEGTNSTITFRVIIWKEEERPLLNEVNSYMDKLFGKFLIIKNLGLADEVILHNSVKYFPQSNTTTEWSLLGTPYSSTIFSSYFEDTCANGGSGILTGTSKMEITNPGINPSIAHWTVKKTIPLKPGESFKVPTDIFLTKVN